MTRLYQALKNHDNFYNDLRIKLSEPHRHYHSFDKHILPMMARFMSTLPPFSDWVVSVIILSIAFHDSVYSSNEDEYSSNESRSVDYMNSYFCIHDPEFFYSQEGQKILRYASDFIHATKDHNPTIYRLTYSDEEYAALCHFLDLDVLDFSRDFSYLLHVEDCIRKEFSRYDDLVYNTERIKVLEGFLQKEKIYYHPIFADYNDIAKANIQKLIDHLKAKL